LANTAWLAGAAVLAVYGLAAGLLGYDAYHHHISLRTLATMLPMLPATMAVGSVSYSDIALEKLLGGVPDLDALTSSLSALARRESRGRPASGLPGHVLRCEGLGF